MNTNTTETGRATSMAEVDLERFLELHREEDEIDYPHRSVDEILLLNDSSSSSNSPSPPSSPSISSTTATDWSELRNRSGNFGDYHAGPPALIPQLFGAVRSNAKPGAALAAAAAASRFVPAPRATAFRSSRSSPSSSDASFKVLESSPVSVGPSVHGDTGQVSPLFAEIDVVRVQEEWVDGPVGTSQGLKDSNLMAEADELLVDHRDELPSVDSASAADHFDDSPAGIQDSPYFAPSSVNASAKFESEEEKFESSFIESIIDSEANGAASENEVITSGDSHGGDLLYEDTTTAVEQNHDLDSVILPDDASNSGGNEEEGAILEVAVSEIMDDFVSDRRKTDNKSQPFLRPLELAEEHEKRLAFSGMHWEEGAAARPMRLEGLRTGSTMVGYFNVDAGNFITHTITSQAFRREHGFPMVIAVHYNYIAVGMSKGLIMVTPSKYSPYHTDNMDPKTLMLGLQGDRLYVPVTSMCFNQQGDILFAGYGDGHYSVWDVQRVSVLKVITEHKAPVVHMLYLGQDVQNSRQFSVVSGDSSGVMKLIRFSIVPWVNRISYSKATKLLGEENSTVICASPLLSCDFLGGALLSSNGNTGVSTSAIGSMMGGVIGGDSGGKHSPADGVVIFVSHQSALVISLTAGLHNRLQAKVSPMVDVYAQIPRPEGVGENSMPYAAWKYMSESNLTSTETTAVEGSEAYSLLAIAWECKVQVAKLVKSKLTVYRKWTLESPATGVAWLDDQMLVVLTAAGQLTLFAKDGNMIHQTSYAIDGSRVDDLISYHTYFSNTYGNPERAHHNCLAVRGANIYILGPSHLVVSRLLPWKERINVLRAAGDWMGALGMALTIYDGHAHGVIDLPRSLDDVQKTVMPYISELILYFVVEGFSYMEIASGNQLGNSEKSDEYKQIIGSEDPDIKEEYIRLGGSAVEFCVHIKRTDILFDEIFAKFCGAKHRETFLELLEPYILKDMLGSLPPEVMQALVEHYSSKGWLQRIEQCVLHMDISSLDFNQVVRLCREHRLHGALIYLFNKGLDDFTTPLEELLAVLRDCTRETAAELGYRILVYLKYCFKGLAFPPGHGILSPIRLPSIRKELLQFLLGHSSAPNSWAITNFPSNGPHPNLLHLLELDTEATLDVLGCALEENQIASSKDSTFSDIGSIEKEDRIVETHNLVLELVDVLSVILEMSNFHVGCCSDSDDDSLAMAWPSKRDVAHILEFIAYYVSCQKAKVSRDILRELLEYLTSDFCLSPSGTFGTSEGRQTKLLNLLEVVPVADWDASNLLQMCEKVHFHQVCGFIHAIRHQYLASLDSYLKAFDEPVHAFSFIHYILNQTRDEESVTFRAEVIARIPDLLKLNRQGGFFLVFELFNGQGPQKMLSELESHPESLFLYLKTLIEVNSSGTLDFSCLRKDGTSDGTGGRKAIYQSDTIRVYLESLDEFLKILRDNPIHVTDEMTEIYLELLCRYERESVLKFLESLESYRVENCLRLCQDYGIIDAAAFLLERVGDVGSALSLILSGLNDKFFTLGDAAVKNLGTSDHGEFKLLLKQKEVKDLLDVVHSCIKLCQRNSPRLEPHESEYLWFQLLDSFCEPLMDSWSDKPKSTVETQMDFRDRSSPNQKDEVVEKITWKITKSHKSVNILKKLFSMFIKEIVEGMIGYVRLPTIMLKLLTDNGSQEFGDFKLTILGMLGMYDFERRILDTAKSLIEDDTYYTMSLLKKGATHGCAPRSSVCCVCSSLLSKGPNSSSGLCVFSCGHAMHVLCELPETSGCPTCVPRKGTERSQSMFLLGNNGKASKTLVKSHQQPRMAALHTPDHDAFENYGSHPFSRFELLHNLQKEQRGVQVENLPLLKLAPPAVYHEKVKKSNNFTNGESSNGSSIAGKTKKQQLKDLKVKGSSVRFPLRSSIFGKEKKSKQ